MNGKGDSVRPMDKRKYDKEFDRIFRKTKAVEETPQFVHDCKHCKFLGRFKEGDKVLLCAGESGDYDLYFCKDGNRNLSSVIARYGDDPSSYISGLHGSQFSPCLAEGVKRAFTKGYLKFEECP